MEIEQTFESGKNIPVMESISEVSRLWARPLASKELLESKEDDYFESLNSILPQNYNTSIYQVNGSPMDANPGKKWRVTIIEAGVSDNKNWYRPSVLKEAIHLFEGAPIRIYQWKQTHFDHMPAWVAARDAGAVTGNTVGALQNVIMESVPSLRDPNRLVPALVADLTIIDGDTKHKLSEAWKAGLMDPSKRALFELSIEAKGPHVPVLIAGNQAVKRVELLESVTEVTIVSRGAAGGRFLALMESAGVHESFGSPEIDPKGKKKKNNEHTFDKSTVENPAKVPNQSNVAKTPDTANTQRIQPDPKPADSPDQAEEENEDMSGQAPPEESEEDEQTPENQEQAANKNEVVSKNSPEAQIKPDEEITDQDVSQGQKAIRLLRAGNLDLGIEILEDVFTKHDEAEDDDEDKEINDTGAKSDMSITNGSNAAYNGPATAGSNGTPKGASKPSLQQQPKVQKPSQNGNEPTEENDDQDADQQPESLKSKKLKKGNPFKESSFFMKQETEPTKMSTRNHQEPQADGSDNGLSESDLRDQFNQFAEFMAEKDTQTEARLSESDHRLAEALELIKNQNAWQEQQMHNSALRESQRNLAFNLKASQLPVQTQTLIAQEFDGRVFAESELHNSIEKHRKHNLSLLESMRSENSYRPAAAYGANSAMQAAGYGAQMMRESGTGHGDISYGRSAIDWVQAEFDRAFGYKPENDKRLGESDRDTYRQLPNQASILRPMQIWHDDPNFNGMGTVGPNALLREATAQSAGLQVVLQNSMTKALFQQFAIQPALWKEIADDEPIANYLEQQRIVLGGLGRLPKVVASDSGTTYLRLGIPSSDQMKFTISNYGGLICVNREAIINDNLQVIQAYPQQAAEAAIMTLNLQVFGTLIGSYGGGSNGNINSALSYTGKPLYDASHNNFTTNALGYQSLVDALNRLSEQRKFGNVGQLHLDIAIGDSTFTVSTAEFSSALKPNDVIKIEAETVKVLSVNTTTNVVTIVGTFQAVHVAGPDTLRIEQLSSPIAFQSARLVVPTALRADAHQLLTSALQPDGSGNGASFLAPFYANKELLPLAVHSMYMQDNLKNWYLAADKPVRVGFLGGRQDPQVMLQDNPLVGNVFAGDLLSWKIFHEYGTSSKGHLMIQAGLVP
jgi:hypothetical protein